MPSAGRQADRDPQKTGHQPPATGQEQYGTAPTWGGELAEEVKQVIAGAKTAKDAGDKAEYDKIMRLLKLKWHPGMSLIVPAIAWPHFSCDLFAKLEWHSSLSLIEPVFARHCSLMIKGLDHLLCFVALGY